MAIDGINDLTKDVDSVNKYVKTMLANNAFSSDKPINSSNIAGLPSPLDYANYFKMISDKLLTPEGAFFIAKQGVLKSMNPVLGEGKLYNPVSALGPLPFAGGEATDFLEAPIASANQTENIILKEDKLKNLAAGTYNNVTTNGAFSVDVQINQFRYPDGKNIQQKHSDNNMFDSDNPMDSNEFIQNDTWQDTGLSGRTVIVKNGVRYDVPDFKRIFDKRATGPAFKDGIEHGAIFFKPRSGQRQRTVATIDDVDWVNDHDTFISQDDFQNGYTEENFEDGPLYVPFYFEDLRKQGRKVFFRAFLDNFSEGFSPKWNSEDYFGRVDPVVTYKNTGRMINLSFKVMPRSPAGFSAMWRKMNNLTKMVYPSFRAGSMSKSPVIKLRIGDVISDGAANGLPGYIDKLDLNYTNAPWEISSYNSNPQTNIEVGKAPMKIEITMTFVVIHENNPEVDDQYRMDFTKFRRVGANPQDTSDIETFTLEQTNSNNTQSDPPAATSPPPETVT